MDITVGQYKLANIEVISGGGFKGRAEILFNSNWGTICDSRWTTVNSIVFCRSMRLSTNFVDYWS